MVIIDTSVVYKWFAQEESDSDKALEILNNHISGKEAIIAPSILLYEIINALVTKGNINLREIKAFLRKLEEIQIQVVEFEHNLMSKAAQLAQKYHVSVYDAAYAVLAKEKKCNLITADINLVNKLNLKFVKSLSII